MNGEVWRTTTRSLWFGSSEKCFSQENVWKWRTLMWRGRCQVVARVLKFACIDLHLTSVSTTEWLMHHLMFSETVFFKAYFSLLLGMFFFANGEMSLTGQRHIDLSQRSLQYGHCGPSHWLRLQSCKMYADLSDLSPFLGIHAANDSFHLFLPSPIRVYNFFLSFFTSWKEGDSSATGD